MQDLGGNAAATAYAGTQKTDGRYVREEDDQYVGLIPGRERVPPPLSRR
ncbi:hypothetical protein AB0D97_31895 [Streptomyces roseus]